MFKKNKLNQLRRILKEYVENISNFNYLFCCCFVLAEFFYASPHIN